MIIYVDIDGTICETDGSNYSDAKPRQEQIDKINKLYDKGNTIIYWTARGTVTQIDWFDLVKNQLTLWGCKYHELILGKPHADFFIDDKGIQCDDFFKDK